MDNKLQTRREQVMSRMRAGRIQMQSYCLARGKIAPQGQSASFLSGKNMAKLFTLFSRHPKPIMLIAAALVLAMLLPKKMGYRRNMHNEQINYPQPTRFTLMIKAIPYIMPIAIRLIQTVKSL